MERRMILSLALLAALPTLGQEVKPTTRPQVVPVDRPDLKVVLPHPIVFSRTGAQQGLWKRETDGTEKRLSSGEDSSPARYPGGRIYFARKAGNGSDIWSMKSDGSDERQEISDGYNPMPHAGVVAFVRKEPGDLGKVWLMVKVASEYKKIASAGWMPRGYYVTRPVFEPGSSRVMAGIFERDDGGSRPKVKVRAYNFDGTYNELWSGAAEGVSGLAAYKDGNIVRRFAVLYPENDTTDLWRMDGGAASVKLIAHPDLERSLDITDTGRMLIGASGKLYLANKNGGGRIPITDGYGGIWLD